MIAGTSLQGVRTVTLMFTVHRDIMTGSLMPLNILSRLYIYYRANFTISKLFFSKVLSLLVRCCMFLLNIRCTTVNLSNPNLLLVNCCVLFTQVKLTIPTLGLFFFEVWFIQEFILFRVWFRQVLLYIIIQHYTFPGTLHSSCESL